MTLTENITSEQFVRETVSVCPECDAILTAQLVERDGRLLMTKTCPQHGSFETLYWSDAEDYRRLMRFQHLPEEGRLRNKSCPNECGPCKEHKGAPLIALIDITNRCDLTCPICFSESKLEMEHTVEPTLEQIEAMLAQLKERGTAARMTVQFSGGEPTLRDDLPEMISMTRDMGYGRIEINTHGLRLAKEEGYARILKEAGLTAIGLQFDGINDEIYKFNRGAKLFAQKQRAVDACKTVGLGVVLVVTLTKGLNEGEIGDIIRFAAHNKEVVKRVVAQTLTFYGRATQFDVNERRATPYDFMKCLEEQTDGAIRLSDFYPVGSMLPVAEFFEQLTGQKQDKLYTHPCCNVATYIYVAPDEQLIPVSKLVQVEPILALMEQGAADLKRSKGVKRSLVKLKYAFKLLASAFTKVSNPIFRQVLVNSLFKGSYDPMADLDDVLMVSCVHHMDKWNFDVERVETCSIHYLTADGNQVPFCSYNTFYRQKAEQSISSGNYVSLDTLRKNAAPGLVQISGLPKRAAASIKS
jgi:uncharacterized radical SAM superfamily Fe-S cluster-containing enzyme